MRSFGVVNLDEQNIFHDNKFTIHITKDIRLIIK